VIAVNRRFTNNTTENW